MRICMLLRSTFTRDARVLREANSLAGAGHQVTVVALRAGDLPEREERDGFVIQRSVWAGSLAGPTIGGRAAPSRWRISRRPPAALMWMRDRTLETRMSRAALEVQADAYHAHDLPTLRPALEAATTHNAHLVYDAHELWPELSGMRRGERARWRRLESRLVNEPDAVIVPSPSRGEELVRLYGIPMPTVVRNCPPAPAVPPDPVRSSLWGLRRKGETLVVYAGGYTPNRGLENVVRAMELLEGFRLVMMGWGPLEGDLRAMASDKVVFVDPVESDAVVDTVAGADIGLITYLPVRRNNELAAPNKLYEYLHAGLAVAASDLPDIRGVVKEQKVGELFDGASPESIAEALDRLRPQLGQYRGAARAAKRVYSWESEEQALLETYGLLSGSAR